MDSDQMEELWFEIEEFVCEMGGRQLGKNRKAVMEACTNMLEDIETIYGRWDNQCQQ